MRNKFLLILILLTGNIFGQTYKAADLPRQETAIVGDGVVQIYNESGYIEVTGNGWVEIYAKQQGLGDSTVTVSLDKQTPYVKLTSLDDYAWYRFEQSLNNETARIYFMNDEYIPLLVDTNALIDSVRFIPLAAVEYDTLIAREVRISWDPNTEDDLQDYQVIIYKDNAQVAYYPNVPDTSQTHVIQNEGLHKIGVSAQDYDGNVSAFKFVEVFISYAIVDGDTTAPSIPVNIKIEGND